METNSLSLFAPLFLFDYTYMVAPPIVEDFYKEAEEDGEHEYHTQLASAPPVWEAADDLEPEPEPQFSSSAAEAAFGIVRSDLETALFSWVDGFVGRASCQSVLREVQQLDTRCGKYHTKLSAHCMFEMNFFPCLFCVC
eukprot:COSAG05_NODE_273_length_12440_cov_22.182805_13_plen_139_part_00